MLQTIYEGEARVPAEWLRDILDTHSISSSVTGSGAEVLSPAGRSELVLPEWEGESGESGEWERQLQRELMLIQRQQHIQKQLLIAQFQKQHQALLRQHQAQLQEHIKLQQALLTLRQQQEALAEERRAETGEEPEEMRGEEPERPRRELPLPQHQPLAHRKKERSKESAMASTEVRQKLHDFLLSKTAKDVPPSCHPLSQRSKLCTSQHVSMEQNSPPLGETPPTFKSPLPSGLDTREDFPLRKTASEPNLKVRSRLKQKVSERRSGPIQRRRDGSVLVTPPKKRPLEPSDSSANDSSPSSGPSSPIGLCGTENGATYRACTTQIESYLPHGGIVKADGSMTLLNLYTSPSLPNLTLGFHSGPAPASPATPLTEPLGTMPIVSREAPKVNNSHQALLQHLLLKEQNRQQKMFSAGGVSALVPPLLAVRERAGGGARPRPPRHRPLSRTQSSPLPQGTLAQLVLQQQHQHFVEKHKQQVHASQMLSQSIEQLRIPAAHLEEDEDGPARESRCLELTLPPAGVIRSHSSGGGAEGPLAQVGVIRVKEEPLDCESGMEQGWPGGGAEEKRGAGRGAGEEQHTDAPPLQVKSEQRAGCMTETDV
ncbi:histone deacetylase 9-B isoform X2 [Brachyhypopomus gauderio]|uniref:histone deacetylase 9-B isoform X2 n=1 Tax=Brachyhypopomus gauderio TaxID=698409 RepID=UPI004041FE7A